MQKSYLKNPKIKINCVQYTQGVKEAHGKTTKGNQENNTSTQRKYQQRDKHFK